MSEPQARGARWTDEGGTTDEGSARPERAEAERETLRLVGVGVGPGDPELVTVRAVRVLREADLTLVPVLDVDQPEPGRAESVVLAYTDRAERVAFALSDRGGVTERRAAAWDAAADRVVRAFAAGAETVAFATIGDPNVYSTFTYLAQTVRTRTDGVLIETVPGITAMQDLAARSGTVLAEGAESLGLVTLTAGAQPFRTALESYDTVVAYKFGSVARDIVAALKDAGRLDDAVYGARLGLPGEDVRPARDISGPVPYLSTLLVPGRRTTRGGKL
ncbi:MAG TPA: precorrin-2 C(20)-methyltransferase [Streptosporangiaceae bacterium]|jgi:precorrin-2/cobalt-factor-2 C20-methyltransferase